MTEPVKIRLGPERRCEFCSSQLKVLTVLHEAGGGGYKERMCQQCLGAEWVAYATDPDYDSKDIIVSAHILATPD